MAGTMHRGHCLPMVDWLDVSSAATRIAYVATAGQTVFPVPFTFADETHPQVYVDDELQVLSTDYVTSGAGETSGGDITFNTGLTAGQSVVIELAVPYDLTIHIPVSGQLDIPAINLQFSLFTMMLKQAISDLPRSLRQPSSDADDISALPVADDRASKYLGFDADGDPVALSSVSTSVAALAFWVGVLSTTNSAAEARTELGISDTSSSIGTFHHLNFR